MSTSSHAPAPTDQQAVKLQLEIKVGLVPIEFLLLALVILTPFYRTQIDPFYDAVVSVLVLPFVLVWVCMSLREGRWEFIRTPMGLPLVLFLLIGVLTTLFSVDVARSTHRFLAILNFTLVGFCLAHLFKQREDFMRTFRLIGVFTFFISVYGIVQYFTGIDPIPVLERAGQGNRAHSIFVWPTTYSTYLSLAMPVVLGLFLTSEKPTMGWKTPLVISLAIAGIMAAAGLAIWHTWIGWNVLVAVGVIVFFGLFPFVWPQAGWTIVFLAAFASILASNSRSGWYSLILALGIVAWYCGRSILWRERRWFAAGTVGVLLLGLFFFTPSQYASSPMLSRAKEMVQPSRVINFARNRETLWKSALTIMWENPFVGTGLGTFAFAYTQFKNPIYGTDMHNFPHNDYLQFAAEMGVPGGLVLLWFLIGYGRTLLALRSLRTQRYGFITIGVIAGTIALLFHAVGDFDLNAPVMLLALGHFIGYTVVVGREEGVLPVRVVPGSAVPVLGAFSARGLGILVGCAFLLLTFIAVKPYMAAQAAKKGSALLQQGKFVEGMALIEQAVAYQPREAPYHANLAAVHENLGVQRRDLPSMVKAEYQYLEAIRLTPLDFSLYVEMARFYFQYGQFLGEGKRYESIRLLKEGISLNPSQKVLHVYLGRNYAQLGMGKEALHELATYLIENPGDQNIQKEYETIAAGLQAQ